MSNPNFPWKTPTSGTRLGRSIDGGIPNRTRNGVSGCSLTLANMPKCFDVTNDEVRIIKGFELRKFHSDKTGIPMT